jgi:hypothetical protein
MLEAQWSRLLHYLRKGLTDAGQDGALLEANDRSRSLRIPIPGTGQWWDYVVEEGDILHGDLTLEAAYLLAEYRIACAKTESWLTARWTAIAQ